MKRTLIPGLYALLAGAFTLILLASVVYSCRSGGNPHQTQSSSAEIAPSEDVQATFLQRSSGTDAKDLTALRSRL